jgi:hypothetical protein
MADHFMRLHQPARRGNVSPRGLHVARSKTWGYGQWMDHPIQLVAGVVHSLGPSHLPRLSHYPVSTTHYPVLLLRLLR